MSFTEDEILEISNEKIEYVLCYNICEFGEYILEYKKSRYIDIELKQYLYWMTVKYEYKACNGNIIDNIYYQESDEMAVNRIFNWYESILKRFHKER